MLENEIMSALITGTRCTFFQIILSSLIIWTLFTLHKETLKKIGKFFLNYNFKYLTEVSK